ncbi:hypothetical protein KP509_20G048700 [Ceratopteris richardii]|uniref:Pentatricopeptide repeat-containing protein n=1 Tax=Ceratopteris richardii TaxID=49495 RepID=A0A8T2SIN2_CERRI|nr:hypothetical protein KP509_20G048700 [Ceratopteris richardii]
MSSMSWSILKVMRCFLLNFFYACLFFLFSFFNSYCLFPRLNNEGLLETVLPFCTLNHQEFFTSLESTHSLLQDCIHNDLGFLRKALLFLTESGLVSVSYVADHVIRLFATHRSLAEACQVFYKVSSPSVYTWHAIISAHMKLGQGNKAFDLYVMMQKLGIEANKFVFMCALQICGCEKGASTGRIIHDELIKSGYELDLSIQNTLVDMYAKCGSLAESCSIFSKQQERNIVSWGAMIAGYAAHGVGIEGLETFRRMYQKGFMPNSIIYLSVLKACGSIEALEQGRLLHMEIIRDGMHLDEVVGSAIIDMYLKCGSLLDADTVFEDLAIKDVVSWSAMILGYADQGHGQKALNLYSDMLSEDICPNKLTFLGVLKACWLVGNLRQGLYMHSEVVSQSLDSDLVVANTLIDMYAKCGALNEARHVFDLLSSKDGVSYNSMIQGYVQNEHSLPALDIYSSMRCRGIRPNKVTFPTILKACSNIRALIEARQIHANVITEEFDNDSTIQSAIVDMYAKCGSMVEAINMFERMQSRDIVLWGTIFTGCAQSGDWQLARQYFLKMQGYNLKPDAWVFNSILTACSHAGEVNEGRWYFLSMIHDYRIKPSADHFNCIIDLLGRSGRLDEASDFFQSIPEQLDINGWTALLTSCRSYGNNKLGNECFSEAM